MPQHERKNRFYWINWQVNSNTVGNEISSIYVIIQKKTFTKNIYRNVVWKLVPGLSVFIKKWAQLEKWKFWKRWLYWICNSKTIKICQN